jgi:hypothetical protein
MKQRRVTITQVAAEAGVSITTIPSVRAPLDESDMPIQNLFYYVDYELTDEPIPDVGRFHAYYRQEKTQKVVHESTEENPAPRDLPGTNLTGDDNYVLLDAAGGVHRTRPRQRPGQRLLLRRLLVPDRQARRPRRTAPYGGQAPKALARARPLGRMRRT